MDSEVYLLWFVEDDEELLTGVYESELDAQRAIERLKIKPGFAKKPGGFQIHDRVLGQDSWIEGFVKD